MADAQSSEGADSGAAHDLLRSQSLTSLDQTSKSFGDAEGEHAGTSAPKSRRPRKPGQPWDGRLNSLTLQEYREMKWGTDACFNATMRRGPAWTLRKSIPIKSASTTNTLLATDVAKALDKVRPSPPNYSCGLQPLQSNFERSQGPAQYAFRCTMETRGHPTCPRKHTGPRFGTAKQYEDVKDAKNPAPGEYDQEAFKKSAKFKEFPAYTAQGREAWKPSTAAPGPGVGTYPIEGKTRIGKDTPIRYSMADKLEPKKQAVGARRFIGPGPPDYQDPESCPARVKFIADVQPQWRFARDTRGLA